MLLQFTTLARSLMRFAPDDGGPETLCPAVESHAVDGIFNVKPQK
jgi:hypothetical protein